MLLVEVISQTGMAFSMAPSRLAPEVLADGNELHFRSDDSLAGIPELGDRVALRSSKRLPLKSGKQSKAIFWFLRAG